MKTIWIAMRMESWDAIEVMGVKLHRAAANLHGSRGFMLVFDDYEKALAWVDGNADRLKRAEITEPQ